MPSGDWQKQFESSEEELTFKSSLKELFQIKLQGKWATHNKIKPKKHTRKTEHYEWGGKKEIAETKLQLWKNFLDKKMALWTILYQYIWKLRWNGLGPTKI